MIPVFLFIEKMMTQYKVVEDQPENYNVSSLAHCYTVRSCHTYKEAARWALDYAWRKRRNNNLIHIVFLSEDTDRVYKVSFGLGHFYIAAEDEEKLREALRIFGKKYITAERDEGAEMEIDEYFNG